MSDEEWIGKSTERLSFSTVQRQFIADLRAFVADELGPRVQARIRERMGPTRSEVVIVETFVLIDLDRSEDWAVAVAEYARKCEPEFLELLQKSLPLEGFVVAPTEIDALANAPGVGPETEIQFSFRVAADTYVVADREQIRARNAAEQAAFVDAAARQVAMQILHWDNSDTTYPLKCPVLITGGNDDSRDFPIDTLDRVRQYWSSRVEELQEQLTASPHISGYRIAVSSEDGYSLTPESVSFICLVSPTSDNQ